MQSNPMVSIVIPFYNGREFIHETLASFCAQTYNNWECLVIDDYSPESAEDICTSFNDSRIKYIKNDGLQGMANARNKGCMLANGEFIALCDQDDISLQNRLICQVEALQKDKDLLLVGTWRRNFGANENEVHYETNPEFIKIRLLGNSQFTNPSIMFRSSLFLKQGLEFNQKMAPADDYDFICRVSLLGKISNIPEVLFLYRIHDKQVSTQKSKEMEKLAYEIRKIYISKLLSVWVSRGLNIDTMAEIFSVNNQLNLSISEISRLFSFWSELNKVSPLWNERYWNAFLGERFLMVLHNLDISSLEKFKLIWQSPELIFSFLIHKKPKIGIKFLLKSLFR